MALGGRAWARSDGVLPFGLFGRSIMAGAALFIIKRRADEFYVFFLTGSEIDEIFFSLFQARSVRATFKIFVVRLDGIVLPETYRADVVISIRLFFEGVKAAARAFVVHLPVFQHCAHRRVPSCPSRFLRPYCCDQRARRYALYRGNVFVGEVVHRAFDHFDIYFVRLRYRHVHLLEARAAQLRGVLFRRKSARYSAGPRGRALLELFRDRLVEHHVRDAEAPVAREDAKGLREHLVFVRREVYHAV